MAKRKITNLGERYFLKRMTAQGQVAAMALRLVTIDFEPSDSLVIENLTLPTWSGYADKILVDGTWEEPATTGDDQGSVAYPEQVFSYTAATEQAVYGHVVLDSSDGILIAEKYDTPIDAVDDGSINVTPRLFAFDTGDVQSSVS